MNTIASALVDALVNTLVNIFVSTLVNTLVNTQVNTIHVGFKMCEQGFRAICIGFKRYHLKTHANRSKHI